MRCIEFWEYVDIDSVRDYINYLKRGSVLWTNIKFFLRPMK